MGNYTINQQLQNKRRKYIAGYEISAEAVTYCRLGTRMTESSDSNTCINRILQTRGKDSYAVVKRRSLKVILQSTQTYANDLFDHCVQSPENLGECCLAVFAANYKYFKTAREANSNENYDEHNEDQEGRFSGRFPRLKNHIGFIKREVKPHIISYR